VCVVEKDNLLQNIVKLNSRLQKVGTMIKESQKKPMFSFRKEDPKNENDMLIPTMEAFFQNTSPVMAAMDERTKTLEKKMQILLKRFNEDDGSKWEDFFKQFHDFVALYVESQQKHAKEKEKAEKEKKVQEAKEAREKQMAAKKAGSGTTSPTSPTSPKSPVGLKEQKDPKGMGGIGVKLPALGGVGKENLNPQLKHADGKKEVKFGEPKGKESSLKPGRPGKHGRRESKIDRSLWSTTAKFYQLKPEERAALKFMELLQKAKERKAKQKAASENAIQKITSTGPKKATQKDNLSSFFSTSGVQDLVTRLALDSKDEKKRPGVKKSSQKRRDVGHVKVGHERTTGRSRVCEVWVQRFYSQRF